MSDSLRSTSSPSPMRSHAALSAALWAGATLGAPPVAAQVNAEVLRPNPYVAGVSGGADASLAVLRGNVELLDVSGAARVQFQSLHPEATRNAPEAPAAVETSGTPAATASPTPPASLPYVHHRAFLTSSARFAERATTAFVNRGFVHARWTGMWHPRVGSDVFTQAQFDEFQRLQLRAVSGVGVRLELLHHPRAALAAGSGFMLEVDRIDVLPGSADAARTVEPRSTSYLTLRLALADGHLLAQTTTYVQPRLDRRGDVRLLEEVEVLARVTDLVQFGATCSVLHDSAPPTGVRETDLRLASTVRVTY